MITFRSMSEDEYLAYLDYFIPDYATEIGSNYGLTQQDALARAKQEISESLPDGVNTQWQALLCLIVQSGKSNKHVGYLWYKPDTMMRTVFIYDFHIFNTCQGQGLGKEALRAFEHYVHEKGCEQIRLRVAGDNARARHLYESSGFGVTGVNMSKTIKRCS